MALLEENRLIRCTLGKDDFPVDTPLSEVFGMIRRCSGAVVLGFRQFHAPSGVFKAGTSAVRTEDKDVYMPTPWNQLEGGMIFALNLPTLIFREAGISGGIFDMGNQDAFVHGMPPGDTLEPGQEVVKEKYSVLFQRWSHRVGINYYAR